MILNKSALRKTAATAFVAATFGLSACSTPPTSQQVGVAGGAILGGAAGNVLFGSTLGTVGGAAAGALLGSEVGKRYR